MFLRKRVLIYCAIQMILGLVFWPWSVCNVLILREDSPSVYDGVDYGLFCFPFVFFAGLNGITSVKCPHVTIATKHANVHLILTIIAHSLCCITYAICGALEKDHYGYKIYCYIALCFFAITGIIFTFWAYKWKLSFEKINHALSLNLY
eukprot:111722_1